MNIKLGRRLIQLKLLANNLFLRGCESIRQALNFETLSRIYYVVPNANWSTDWDGYYITHNISRQFSINANVTPIPYLLKNHILHYSELGSFTVSLNRSYNYHNKIIATIFHGSLNPQFPKLAQNVTVLLENTDKLERVVTACQLMQTRLLDWGVPAEKVVCIPLGVDLDKFCPTDESQRQMRRQQFGIPEDAFCIGSFQKDGDGWGEGLAPKWVKGPDIFLDVMERVFQRQKNLFVLLTGPARGYVKQGLDALGIPYQHHLFADYYDVVGAYHCLDAYVVASREEGGPKAVLEALACSIPLVSTRVGMAPDVIEHGVNGLLNDVEDVPGLAESLAQLIDNRALGRQLAANGLAAVQAYDWQKIAARYYRELYAPVLATL